MRHIHIRLPVSRLRWAAVLVAGSIVAGFIMMTSYRNAAWTNERVDIDIPVTTSAVVRVPVLSEFFFRKRKHQHLKHILHIKILSLLNIGEHLRISFYCSVYLYMALPCVPVRDYLALTGQPVDMSINLFSGPVKVLQSSQIQVL